MIESKAFFVISEWNNDISWLKDYKKEDYIVYDKSDTLPSGDKILKVKNVGYNIWDQFDFILNHYNNLPEFTAFLQGDPFPHCRKETFDKIIYNECFTPIEDYSDAPESNVHIKDTDGGYMELNTSYYLYLKERFKHRYFSNYNQFLDCMFENPEHPKYIRFSPGAQYLVPRENILFYSKEFYKRLISFIDYDQFPVEAFLIERALYTIYSNKYKERKIEE